MIAWIVLGGSLRRPTSSNCLYLKAKAITPSEIKMEPTLAQVEVTHKHVLEFGKLGDGTILAALSPYLKLAAEIGIQILLAKSGIPMSAVGGLPKTQR